MSIKSYLKGKFAETFVNMGINFGLDSMEYTVHANITLELNDMTTQIDHIIVSRYGIFVVETKNYKGWIYGNPKSKKWTQVLYKQKYSFQNPLHQNYKHIKYLQNILSVPSVLELKEDDFISVILFAGECKIKTKVPDNILTSGVATYIKTFKEKRLDDFVVKKLNERLSRKKLKAGILTDIKHVSNLKRQFKN